MFDQIVNDKSRSRSRTGAIAGASIAVHVAFGVVLAARSAWAIEKLALPPSEPLMVAPSALAAPAPPPPPPGGPAKAPQHDRKTPRPSKVARLAKSAEVVSETASSTDSDAAGRAELGGAGGANGIPGGVVGGLGLEGLGDANVVPVTSRPQDIPLRAVQGLRIAGNSQIRPPQPTRRDMERSGHTQVRASAKLCLTEGGKVRSATILEGSGFSGWDREIARQMRSWRYKPFLLGGVATAVCTRVTFVYEP